MRQTTDFLLLMLPLLFSSCGKATTDTPVPEEEAVPVRFDTYVAKSATTRAADDLTLSNISDLATLRNAGFVVFGYYDDNKEYSSTDDIPNFMYKQKVTWNETSKAWQYAPLKYWPQETGSDESDGRADRLSFFACAPYLNNDSRLTFSGSNAKGDPVATYTTPDDLGKCLDVLYATRADGQPLTNMTKQSVGDGVTMYFHHTMSRLNFNVRGAFDEVAAGDSAKADSTRITVESIVLETESGDDTTDPLFFTSGTLNLNTGIWSNAANSASGTPKITLSGGALNSDVLDQGDKLVYQMKDGDGKIIPGVDETWRNAGNGYLTLLPNTGITMSKAPKLKITIVYYTTSDDSRLVLSGGRSRVKNTVSNTLSGFIFERGKAYAINMLIGMTSVKFTVQVQIWRDPITFSPIVEDWSNGGSTINFDSIDD